VIVGSAALEPTYDLFDASGVFDRTCDSRDLLMLHRRSDQTAAGGGSDIPPK
jgi:hypothetical protein